jgi:hypothetical protein
MIWSDLYRRHFGRMSQWRFRFCLGGLDARRDGSFYVPHVVGTDDFTMGVADMGPTLGSFGLAGAHARIGPGGGS